jgi:hypothetical protein
MEIPRVHWIQWTKLNSNGHSQVHWIHWIHCTLSFGYLNGLVSTWCSPYACHYVIQRHVNWPNEKANVRCKFHLSIGSNGQTKFQLIFPGPLDPLDPLDTFVWLYQWPSIYMLSISLSLRHSNTYWLTNWKSKCPIEIPLVHWIQWTNTIPMDIFMSIGSIGSIVHFRLAISMAYYLHDVRHMLVITSFKDMLIDQMKKQMSDGNLTCPLDPKDKQNFNGHFHIHWIHWIHWTLCFRYLNGLVSTWCPYACHYVIQIHINWPTEKANVRWKLLLSIGSNGQTKFQRTFPGPLDPLDPFDTFVCLSQWPSIYMMSICLSLHHSKTW